MKDSRVHILFRVDVSFGFRVIFCTLESVAKQIFLHSLNEKIGLLQLLRLGSAPGFNGFEHAVCLWALLFVALSPSCLAPLALRLLANCTVLPNVANHDFQLWFYFAPNYSKCALQCVSFSNFSSKCLFSKEKCLLTKRRNVYEKLSNQ